MKMSASVSKGVGRVLQVVCSVLTLLFVSLPLFSQGSQGTIQGGVYDTTGGTIAGATVTITDVERGTSRNLTTGAGGQYAAPNLNAGTYTVRAQAGGFRTVQRENVLLQVGSNVRVDLTLAPGEQTQTITVTEEIPAIDPTSATLGGAVSNQQIVELPLNGRNFFRLLELRPGVVSRVGSSSAASSSNGRRMGADVLLVEGITQFDMATRATLRMLRACCPWMPFRNSIPSKTLRPNTAGVTVQSSTSRSSRARTRCTAAATPSGGMRRPPMHRITSPE
jgi:hypothetical protein